jgi:peptide/nickel transport system substrate-binding protein
VLIYPRVLRGVTLALLLVSTACAAPAPAGQSSVSAQPQRGSGPRKILNLALLTTINGFSITAGSTTAGGGLSYNEIHSQALFTADKTTGRPVPRLVSEMPSLDNQGLLLAPDGKLIATYKLRPDVTWADGAPFTSQDLLFSFKMVKNPTLPIIDTGPAKLMESATAPDAQTFVITWSQPYYLADAIGLRALWPMPAHLLEDPYVNLIETQKDVDGFLALPYWSSEYVHIGPFKLTNYVPQVEADFDAVETYFLGRPKVDRIVVKQYTDSSTVVAALLGGGLDLTVDAVINPEQAASLKERWAADGGGKVFVGTGTTQFVAIQFENVLPGYQPALADQRVRQGLYQAIDRESYAEAAAGGTPGTAASAMLPPDDPLYRYVQNGWVVRYPNDQAQAARAFQQAGWRPGANGYLVNGAGEQLHVELRGTAASQRRAPIIADMWKQVGVDVEIAIVPASRSFEREYRQAFPGGEITAQGSHDAILTRLECAEQPTAQNRFSGNNRGHWCSPDFDQLVLKYRTSLREDARGQTFEQIQNFVLDDLPLMPLNWEVIQVPVRKGVTAYEDDFAGGSEAGRIYGTYTRNAHEWDIRN